MVCFASALRKYKEGGFVLCTGTMYFSFVLLIGQLLANCSLATLEISQSWHRDRDIQLHSLVLQLTPLSHFLLSGLSVSSSEWLLIKVILDSNTLNLFVFTHSLTAVVVLLCPC